MARRMIALALAVALAMSHATSALAAEVVVTGDDGVAVVLAAPARRIVSLYAGHSENIVALGGGPALVGVAEGDDPDLFPGLPRLPIRVDAERILALEPDLLLIRPFAESVNEGVLRTLSQGGVPVLSLSPPLPATMESYLDRLSTVTGAGDGAAAWRRALNDLENQVSPRRRPRVFLETSGKGLRTCSPDSWAAMLISLAGGENAAADAVPLREGSSIAPWGEERLLELAERGLDFYVVQAGPMNQVAMDDVLARPWISGLRGARVVVIEEEEISRPSLLRMERTVRRLRTLFEGERLAEGDEAR